MSPILPAKTRTSTHSGTKEQVKKSGSLTRPRKGNQPQALKKNLPKQRLAQAKQPLRIRKKPHKQPPLPALTPPPVAGYQHANPAWQPLAIRNPVNSLLLILCLMGLGVTPFIAIPLPRLFTETASGMALLTSPPPLLLNITSVDLFLLAGLFGRRVSIVVSASLVIAQLLGAGLFTNMGTVTQPGPTLGYGVGLIIASGLTGWLLTGKQPYKPSVSEFNSDNSQSKQGEQPPTASTAKPGDAIRLKRQTRQVKGIAGMFHAWCTFVGHSSRVVARTIKQSGLLLYRLGLACRPWQTNQAGLPVAPAGVVVAHGYAASLISVITLHAVGLIGLALWGITHHYSYTTIYPQLLAPWLTQTALNQGAYEWLVTGTLLIPIRYFRQWFKLVLY